MNMLSGSNTPLESMPEALQLAMQAAPSTHVVGVLFLSSRSCDSRRRALGRHSSPSSPVVDVVVSVASGLRSNLNAT
jgi:hypothetical protein